ncbi:MAG: chorismate mutase [Candidatus Gastranaerophilales bacterium]|nr:chorismate mutase [Candidatus Gastranaerophilales bacterium]
MLSKGIRGAITVEENTSESICKATVELIERLSEKNNIEPKNISHAIFTLTDDLNAEFPAKFVRQNCGWDKTAMMCFHELNVPNSLPKCLRILVVINCDDDFEPEFVYLKGAEKLRAKI